METGAQAAMMATVTEVLKINNWEVVTILWLFPVFVLFFFFYC